MKLIEVQTMSNKELEKAKPIVKPYFYGLEYYCPSCNNYLGTYGRYEDIEDLNFCSKCGQPLEWESFKGK